MSNTQTLAQKPVTHSNGVSPTDTSTSPMGLAPNLTPSINGTADAKNGHTWGERVKIAITAYVASLIMTGVIAPFVASVMMVAFYLALPDAFISLPQLGIDPSSKWYAIVVSTLVTCALWLIGALLRCPFVTASSANSRSYGLL